MAGDLQSHFRAARRHVLKWNHYFPVYERLLSKYRGTAVTLVEVGVGEGGSLEGWRGFLGPSARIIGIDCDPAAQRLEADGFEIILGDQSRQEFWADLGRRTGPIDVLIDDGGHSSVEQIVTVGCGLPHVRDGGVIIVEDTHTSYMPVHYPAAARYGFMEFAAHVVDVMHARNPFVTEDLHDSAGLGRAIHSVEFHESLVIFHVDRRLCVAATAFEAGMPATNTDQRRGNVWTGPLVRPFRRVLGKLRRAALRQFDASRVRRYFR